MKYSEYLKHLTFAQLMAEYSNVKQSRDDPEVSRRAEAIEAELTRREKGGGPP